MELDSIVSSLTKYQPLIYFVGILIWCFIILIDNINIGQLEKKLMTPKAKFMYYFSQVFLMSVFTFALTLLFAGKETLKVLNYEDTFLKYTTLITIFICIILFHSFLIFLLWGIAVVTSINYKYYIILEDNNKWEIIRMNKSKYVLVEHGTNLKFINEPFKENYIKEIYVSELKKKIFNWLDLNKKYTMSLTIFLLSLLIFSGIRFEFISPGVNFLIFLLSALLFFILVALVATNAEYKGLEDV